MSKQANNYVNSSRNLAFVALLAGSLAGGLLHKSFIMGSISGFLITLTLTCAVQLAIQCANAVINVKEWSTTFARFIARTTTAIFFGWWLFSLLFQNYYQNSSEIIHQRRTSLLTGILNCIFDFMDFYCYIPFANNILNEEVLYAVSHHSGQNSSPGNSFPDILHMGQLLPLTLQEKQTIQGGFTVKKVLSAIVAVLFFAAPALAHIKPKDPSHMNPHWLSYVFVFVTFTALAWMGWRLSKGFKKPEEK